MTDAKVTYMHTPASFGATLTADDGGRCQIVLLRGTGDGLPLFGMLADDGKWITMTLAESWRTPRTLSGFKSVVARFASNA